MNHDILFHRLENQGLVGSSLRDPAEVVKWMTAVQAQDYFGSLWAIASRAGGATEELVEQAIAEKRIVRSWPMRGTLHFVSPDDLRWMLALLAPRAVSRSQLQYRENDLTARVFRKCEKLITTALTELGSLTRPELYEVLEKAGVATRDQRGLHIIGFLAQHGLICFGPRRGKQHTLVLLDEWLPPSRLPDREQALSGLVLRYFASHGPATTQDFAWWSGLAPVDIGFVRAVVKDKLEHVKIGDQEYWFRPSIRCESGTSAHLLPSYDEFTVAYKDRRLILNPEHEVATGHGIFRPVLLVNGRIAGTWKRTLRKADVQIEVTRFSSRPGDKQMRKLVQHYGAFCGRKVFYK